MFIPYRPPTGETRPKRAARKATPARKDSGESVQYRIPATAFWTLSVRARGTVCSAEAVTGTQDAPRGLTPIRVEPGGRSSVGRGSGLRADAPGAEGRGGFLGARATDASGADRGAARRERRLVVET